MLSISVLQLPVTKGAAEPADWARSRGLDVSRARHWYVEVQIATDAPGTLIELNIYPEEWGLVFRRDGRVSSIRVTDVPFVHGLDDFKLLPMMPALADLDRLLDALQHRFEITFDRSRPKVHSNVKHVDGVRAWLTRN